MSSLGVLQDSKPVTYLTTSCHDPFPGPLYPVSPSLRSPQTKHRDSGWDSRFIQSTNFASNCPKSTGGSQSPNDAPRSSFTEPMGGAFEQKREQTNLDILINQFVVHAVDFNVCIALSPIVFDLQSCQTQIIFWRTTGHLMRVRQTRWISEIMGDQWK